MPEEEIPVAPVIAPPVEIFKAEEVREKVPVAFPIVVEAPAPEASIVVDVEERVVNAPVLGLDAPIVVPLIDPPLIATVVTVPKLVHVAPAAVGVPVIVGEVREGVAIVGEEDITILPVPVWLVVVKADPPLITKDVATPTVPVKLAVEEIV